MNYADIISQIRSNDYTPRVAQLLLDKKCFYLLSKSREYSPQAAMYVGANALVTSRRYKHCEGLFSKLEAIPYAHLKGGILSKRIYGTPFHRASNDIDILISNDSLSQVKEILFSEGFIQGRLEENKIVPFTRHEIIYQKSFSHQTAPFLKQTGDVLCPFINIDLNLDIMWGESKKSVDINEFLTHTEVFDICGVNIKGLSSVFDFISLCLHHYKDMNSLYLLSKGGYSLSKLADVYFYLKNTEISTSLLCESAKSYGVDKYLYYVIHQANEIFGDNTVAPYLNALKSAEGTALLNKYGLAEDEISEWKIPFEERLFDSEFPSKFYASLSDAHRQKADTNRKFM